ncbi:MAG: hypothetical protein JW734_07280 [Candidatus Omnitrophica bacterium]|nr:hypothetical protein [Candidatus Omnitrophota bacterium]
MKNFIFYLILLIFALGLSSGFSAELIVKTFPIKSADPRAVESIAESLKSEKGKVTFDPRTNLLVVVDTPQNVDRIQKVIQEMDIDLKMVQIEVSIIETASQILDDIGLKSSYFILPKADLAASMSLLENSQDTHIRSKSTLTTLSNQPARIQVTEDAVIGEHHTVYYPSGHRVVEPVTTPVGSILEVLPSVNSDNTITLTIKPFLSTLDDQSVLPLERSMYSRVVINDQDTIVLGGVDSGQDRDQSRSVILGIPLSKTKSSSLTKTAIFLTAKIMD